MTLVEANGNAPFLQKYSNFFKFYFYKTMKNAHQVYFSFFNSTHESPVN